MKKIRKYFHQIILQTNCIDFARLSPKISSEIDGSELHLGKMSISNAGQDAMYNVVSTCSYKNTPDKVLFTNEKDEFEDQLRGKGLKQKKFYLKQKLVPS